MCESRKEGNISKRGIFIYFFLSSCDKKVGVIFGISGIGFGRGEAECFTLNFSGAELRRK
jgi:hypothetical protein